MFRRLFFTFSLFHLAILAGIILVTWSPGHLVTWSSAFGGAAMVAVLASLVLSARLTRRLRRRLDALTAAVDKLGEGHNGQRVFTERRDEIGELVLAFNRMSEQLD